MPQNNPSPHAYKVWDALAGEYLKNNIDYRWGNIFVSPDGTLYRFHCPSQDDWRFFPLAELLPSGQPRYVIERGMGKVDCEKKAIFEGDRVQYSPDDPEETYSFIVKNSYGMYCTDDGDSLFDFDSNEILIIGNVHNTQEVSP